MLSNIFRGIRQIDELKNVIKHLEKSIEANNNLGIPSIYLERLLNKTKEDLNNLFRVIKEANEIEEAIKVIEANNLGIPTVYLERLFNKALEAITQIDKL